METVEKDHSDTACTCARCGELEAKVEKLKKIIAVLQDRVEKSTNMDEDAYMLFQTATVLESKVNERTAALNRALKELESSNRELQKAKQEADTAREEIHRALLREKELSELKTRFVTIASHEFRTPLTTIQSSAEMIERFDQKWGPDKKVKHLKRIKSNVRHMTSLLEDVLLVGRIDSGRLKLEVEEFEIAAFILDVFDEIKIGAEDSHELNCTILCDEKPIMADKRMVRVVINNLLSNAMKYSDVGSKVDMTVSEAEQFIVIEVQDEGIGIPSEDLEHLFEPFHRAGNVDNRQGTGLGLAILHRMVNLHGGQIEVDSKIGVGTSFRVSIPVHMDTNRTVERS